MTKKDLILFLRDLEKVRELLTPEQAAQVPNLFPKLASKKEIKKGDRFLIDGEVLEAATTIAPTEENIKNKLRKPTRFGGR